MMITFKSVIENMVENRVRVKKRATPFINSAGEFSSSYDQVVDSSGRITHRRAASKLTRATLPFWKVRPVLNSRAIVTH